MFFLGRGSTTVQEIWEASLRAIESKIKQHNFDMWIKPIEYLRADGGTVHLRAPNRFIRDWFEDNYLPTLVETMSGLGGQAFKVQLDIREDSGHIEMPAPRPVPIQAPPSDGVPQVVADSQSGRIADGKYTFDTFIVGPSNQLAWAASRAVAEVPAGKYNPLFIYGGVGLGKTHLLYSIGAELKKRQPGWKVQYLKAES